MLQVGLSPHSFKCVQHVFPSLLNLLSIFTVSVLDTPFNFLILHHHIISSRVYKLFLCFAFSVVSSKHFAIEEILIFKMLLCRSRHSAPALIPQCYLINVCVSNTLHLLDLLVLPWTYCLSFQIFQMHYYWVVWCSSHLSVVNFCFMCSFHNSVKCPLLILAHFARFKILISE